MWTFTFKIEQGNGAENEITVEVPGGGRPRAECLRTSMDVVPDDAIIRAIYRNGDRVL